MAGPANVPQPKTWRLVLGFAITPLAVPFAFLCHGLIDSGYLPGALSRFFSMAKTGYVPALVLGIPLYLVLRGRVALTLPLCALAAAVIGGTVGLVLDLALDGIRPQPLSTRALIYLATLATGALHGLLFWFIVVFRGRPAATKAPAS